MIILIQLFIAFVEIGAMSFGGGYASLPLIQDVIVNQKRWLNLLEMTDIVIISQLTSGPIAINAVSFVGTKMHNIAGAVVATMESVLPQTIILLILGTLLFKGKRLAIVDNILKALRPGVVGLIAAATISMIIVSVFPDGIKQGIDYKALIGFLLGLYFYTKKMDMIKLIGLGAGIGLGLAFVGTLI